ncbi:intradiol ring-cleavage dioxygenase [Mesorhizobium xinjiangense]|uniref:intradiol ring-cleavage dioxygenase n=1 Tax=Mesorhizobium xinjiangense TaxID=2678685 RepID=UPI0012ED0419|nr:intradiol ring-cleavage dioxygenase [Mesorhizobium xinjiangense]
MSVSAPKGLSRRRALGLIAVTAGGGPFLDAAAFAAARPAQAAALITGAGVCSIMPQTTEGPFYFDPSLDRGDITEGRRGLPLNVRIQVVDAGCAPIPGARVDIWHCDAEGRYSGYARQPGGIDTSGETFLRGTRMADGEGIASFTTIYPGWYPGRTPHIHFKAFPSNDRVLTGQMFFPDEVSRQVYETVAPYNDRGTDRVMVNARDGIARRAGPAALAELVREGGRVEAALVVAVAER